MSSKPCFFSGIIQAISFVSETEDGVSGEGGLVELSASKRLEILQKTIQNRHEPSGVRRDSC